jgi:hypothetical protein
MTWHRMTWHRIVLLVRLVPSALTHPTHMLLVQETPAHCAALSAVECLFLLFEYESRSRCASTASRLGAVSWPLLSSLVV